MQLIWRQAEGPLISAVLDTPIGRLSLSARGEALVSIDFVDDVPADCPTNAAGLTPLLAQAGAALTDYFQTGATLHLPLNPAGTAFQRRVWQRLADISSGSVVSYGHLAQDLGSGARAVAGACRANPYPLVIPCHRVVAAHGLGGYCGATTGNWLDIKRWLLAHEQRSLRC